MYMPKLYEYLGFIIFFYSNEHEPIHVHGRIQGAEMKAEFTVVDGMITAIHFKQVKNKPIMRPSDLKHFQKFVQAYQQDILRKWNEFFVENKNIECEIITKRV